MPSRTELLAMPWQDVPIVAIDFETTGPIPTTARPVEVAAVRFEHGREVASFRSLVQPGEPIPAAATATHRITDEMVRDAPTLAELAGDLAKVAAGAWPLAYNARYDRTVLHAHIQGMDVPMFDPANTWVCPCVIVRETERVMPGRGYYKLQSVCKRWGVELLNAHGALDDARAAGALLYRLAERGRIKPCTLERLVQHTERRGLAQEECRGW